MGLLKTSIFILLTAFLLKNLYLYLVHMGVGIEYSQVLPGLCRVVPGVECGSEKVSVTSDGLAFVTNGFSQLTPCNKEYLKGHIYIFDFTKPENNVQELTIKGSPQMIKTFRPHGMDIFEKKDLIEVYVVNHVDGGGESIELFHYRRTKVNEIIHIRSITNEKFICLNDIAIVGSERFYVTNYLKYCHYGTISGLLETFLHLPTSDIVYYDTGVSRIVADNEVMYNGVVISEDQKQLIVAAGQKRGLDVFHRDTKSGDLTYFKTISLVGHPDNIALHKSTGSYYVGVHKKIFNFVFSVFNYTEALPGTGVLVKPSDETWEFVNVTEILHLDGQNFVKGISTVVFYEDQYLFGSVFHKLGYCQRQ